MTQTSRSQQSMDRYSSLIREVGPTQWWGNPHYQHPWYVRNVLCEDGRRRTAYLGQDADTYFSWPARVKIAAKWRYGFITTQDDENGPDTLFTENKFAD